MEVRMSTSAKGTKVPPAARSATLGWLAKPYKVSPAHATASMIARNLVRTLSEPPLPDPRRRLRCRFDQLGADQERATTRREQPLPDQLRDRTRDRFAAGADLVGQLLLRRTVPNEKPFGSRRPVLPADGDQPRDDPLLHPRQRQPGGQLLRTLEARDQLGPQRERQIGSRPQTGEKRLPWDQQQGRG